MLAISVMSIILILALVALIVFWIAYRKKQQG